MNLIPWKAYHVTPEKNKEKILTEGLRFEEKTKDIEVTELLSGLLNFSKPAGIPTWWDRMKCVFLSEIPQQFPTGYLQFEINLLFIDTQQLFVADYKPVQVLFEGILLSIQSNDVNDIPTDKAREYWNSIRPYSVYLQEQNPTAIEIMYFGHVPPKAVRII